MKVWMAAVSVAVVLLLAGAAAIHLGGDARSADGPMHVPAPHGGAVTLRPGAAFTDGFEVLSITGDEPATIDSVALVDSEGFELLGAKIASPDRPLGFIQFLRGWPPTGKIMRGTHLTDAEGATITPTAAGWELFVGIRVTGAGVLKRGGIRVDYSVAGERFTATFPAQLVVCTSRRLEVAGHCPMGA